MKKHIISLEKLTVTSVTPENVGDYFLFDKAEGDLFFGSTTWNAHTFFVHARNRRAAVIVWRQESNGLGRWHDRAQSWSSGWQTGHIIHMTFGGTK